MEITLSKLTGNIFGAIGIVTGPILVLVGAVIAIVELTWGIPLAIGGASIFLAGLIALPVVRRTLDARLNIQLSKYATGGIVAGFTGVSVVSVLLAVLLFLGAALGGPGFQQADETAWNLDTNSAGTQADGTVTLQEGEYGVYTFQSGVSFQLAVEFESPSGQPVDVFVMDDDEFDRFRDRESVSFYPEVSGQATTGYSAQATMTAGNYVLIIDNTGIGEASPDGEVTVRVSFSMQ